MEVAKRLRWRVVRVANSYKATIESRIIDEINPKECDGGKKMVVVQDVVQ